MMVVHARSVWVLSQVVLLGVWAGRSAGEQAHGSGLAGPAAATEVAAAPAPEAPTTAPAGDSEPPAGPGGRWLDPGCIARGWQGAQEMLSSRGFTLELGYTHVWQANARGGLDTANGQRHTGSYDVALTIDTQEAGLWKGGEVLLCLEGAFGEGIGPAKVGDLLGVNADAQTAGDCQVSSLWYGQRLLDDRLVVRAGKIDPSCDFDTNAYANCEVTQFLNGGLVNNPTIPFPDYALGVQATCWPVPWAYYSVGLFDAQANGGQTGFNTATHDEAWFFLIQEVGFTPQWKIQEKVYPGAYRAGCWYDPVAKETFLPRPGTDEPDVRTGDWGCYLSFDQLVYRENTREADEQGLGVFCRCGWARGDVNAIEQFYSWGLSYKGLLPGRNEDVLGVGLAYADLSDRLGRAAPHLRREAVAELYYNIQITPWMQITPDLQIVMDPGGDDALRNAIVAGVRLAVYF